MIHHLAAIARPVLILAIMLSFAATARAETGNDPAAEALKALENLPPVPAQAEALPPETEKTAAPGVTDVPATPATKVTPPAAPKPPTPAPAVPKPGLISSMPKDIVLVLDNSGSMKKNDPQFIAKQAVAQFINNLDTTSHIAVVIFDSDIKLIMPLTEINDSTRGEILQNLAQINYKGLYTNSPDAIEKAIYELKNNSRVDAKKAIIFMTDGIVDTGNPERDQNKASWLKNELAESAKDADIAIYGIAFTEEADFQLIQSLAQKTHGEYYRAILPEDLQGVYEDMQVAINKVARQEIVPTAPAPPPPPVIIEMPAHPQPDSQSDQLNSMLIMAALAVMIIAVIFLVLMVIRTYRKQPAEAADAPEAYLVDIHNYTPQPRHKLSNKPAILGRSAGTDMDHMNYIVIPQTTIGRRHALIEYKNYAYWIMDQGSINGTFVNNEIITGETRLKHGDKIRLHKYEFEFIMPEMADAGQTVVSHTVMSKAPGTPSGELTAARDGVADDFSTASEPDFDLSDMAPSEISSSDEDATVRKETVSDQTAGASATIVMDTEDADMDIDVTLRPDEDNDKA